MKWKFLASIFTRRRWVRSDSIMLVFLTGQLLIYIDNKFKSVFYIFALNILYLSENC